MANPADHDDDRETVYRAGSGSGPPNQLHADPECRSLVRADQEPVERDAAAYPDWYARCEYCWPASDPEDANAE